MWITFIPDLIVALFGAALTVLIAYLTFKLNQQREEVRALNALVDVIHHRRALAGDAVLIPNAQASGDFDRVKASVASIRDEIGATRRQVRAIPSVQRPLMAMSRHCNYFLEAAEWNPDRYAILAAGLRDDLHASVQELAQARRGVRALRPGGGAFAEEA